MLPAEEHPDGIDPKTLVDPQEFDEFALWSDFRRFSALRRACEIELG